MNILIPILKKNETWKEHKKKLTEEYDELCVEIDHVEKCEEITEEVARKVAEEAMDIIQVCVGIIYKVLKAHRRIVLDTVKGHIVKLIDRGWKFMKILKVEED